MPSKKEEVRRRAERRRKVTRLAVWFAVGLTGVFGAHQLVARHLWNNFEFIVWKPVATTDGTLSPDRILEEAGIQPGCHILSYDLQAARRRLSENPLISEVTVTRELPNRLGIRVKERAGVAWLTCDSPPLQGFTSNPALGNLLLDEKGVPFPCERVTDSLLKLPAIHLRALPQLKLGVSVGDPSVERALALLAEIREPLIGRNLDVVEIDVPNGWSLVTKLNDDSVVTFAQEGFGPQFARLRGVLDHCEATQQRLATANVLLRTYVPVTFAPPDKPAGRAAAGQEPPPPPRQSPPPHTRSRPAAAVRPAPAAPASVRSERPAPSAFDMPALPADRVPALPADRVSPFPPSFDSGSPTDSPSPAVDVNEILPAKP